MNIRKARKIIKRFKREVSTASEWERVFPLYVRALDYRGKITDRFYRRNRKAKT